MVITVNQSHISCLELGFSCGWGEFWVDPVMRGLLETQLQGKRVIVNCDTSVLGPPRFLGGMTWLGIWDGDPLVVYPLFDWVRQSKLRVTAWLIDGQYPWIRLRQLRWGMWLIGGMMGLLLLGWQLRVPRSSVPVGSGLPVTWVLDVLSEVDRLGGVMVSMEATHHTRTASLILPSNSPRPSFDEQTEWVELNQSWQGGIWHERQPI